MNILYSSACIIAILFMLVFIFIGIWLFIIALKAFKQLKYRNYILQKIYDKLDKFTNNSTDKNELSDSLEFFDSKINEVSDHNNIKIFDKNKKGAVKK